MDIDYQVGEVELSYKSTVREKRKIATSSDAYGMLLSTFREDTIGYKEYFRFLSVWLNRLKNKLLANYLRSSGNELAIVRISAICDAMLSNNSFGDKDIIILWKSNKHNTNFIAPNHRELSLSIFAPLTWIRTDIHLKRLIAAISLFSLFTYVVFT